jgi:hypothetical protein
MLTAQIQVACDARVLSEQLRLLDWGRYNLERGRQGCCWFRCGFWRFLAASRLVARQTGIVGPALVVSGEGLDLADVVASEAVFLPLNGVRHRRHLTSFLGRCGWRSSGLCVCF